MAKTKMTADFYNAKIAEYIAAGVDAFFLSTVEGDTVVTRSLPLHKANADIMHALFNNGGTNFRVLKRNIRVLRSLSIVDTVPLAEIDVLDGANYGEKMEVHFSGKFNTTKSLIDFEYYGIKVQLKTSFPSVDGYSNSNQI